MNNPAVAEALTPSLMSGDVATCSIVDIELLYSARGRADFEAIRTDQAGFERVDILQADFDRAIDVMGLLARVGHHRSAGLPDLLTAALAERVGLVVVHYDADFDHIGKVTGQPMQWVVPRGTV
jgi:predicted nucleic acid-binding protein